MTALCESLPATSDPEGRELRTWSVAPSVVDGLEVDEGRGGLTVYDPATDRVHVLNETAAIVFVMCDGRRSASGIAAFMAEAFALDEAPLGEVESCLATLGGEGLLR
jgi:Coenzyme PQQ synthesis protein D (PqqD)